MLDRRRFIRNCAIGTAAILTMDWSIRDSQAAGLSFEDGLSRRLFLSLRGETFEVFGGEGLTLVTPMRLIGVDDVASSSPELEQFVLSFSAPSTTALNSGVYTVRHTQAGSTQLMLRRGQDSGPLYFYAEFNVLRSA